MDENMEQKTNENVGISNFNKKKKKKYSNHNPIFKR